MDIFHLTRSLNRVLGQVPGGILEVISDGCREWTIGCEGTIKCAGAIRCEGKIQGLVKGAKLCLNPYFFGWLEK